MRFTLSTVLVAIAVTSLAVPFLQQNVTGLIVGGMVVSLAVAVWAATKLEKRPPS